MKQSIKIVFYLYFSLGTIFLPMSDFSVIENLPKMYANCKATEDKDMTPIDFITDHLVNIDSLFDKHNHGDEQKPHKNIDFTLHHSITSFFQEITTIEFHNNKTAISNAVQIPDYENSLYFHNPISSLFRPPINV